MVLSVELLETCRTPPALLRRTTMLVREQRRLCWS
ncbi:unnamed protein product [Haemonchus placei]|uniref:Uncharacterized protein n=1 Tax=Haemonchus placei TaxID=6290 RepID=A0A0N4WXS1_HAEPC|nr:unnamed protein product [Haemonchus placei]